MVQSRVHRNIDHVDDNILKNIKFQDYRDGKLIKTFNQMVKRPVVGLLSQVFSLQLNF